MLPATLFRLCASDAAKKNPRLVVEKLVAHVSYYILSPKVASMIEREMQSKHAVYKFPHIKTYGPFDLTHHGTGHRHIIFRSRVPEVVVVFFADTNSVVGDYTTNPFKVKTTTTV